MSYKYSMARPELAFRVHSTVFNACDSLISLQRIFADMAIERKIQSLKVKCDGCGLTIELRNKNVSFDHKCIKYFESRQEFKSYKS